MVLDPKQKCTSCGMTRDAHWGPRYLASSVCTGFVSGTPATEREKKLVEACFELALLARVNPEWSVEHTADVVRRNLRRLGFDVSDPVGATWGVLR
jgi:hypothetical protein